MSTRDLQMSESVASPDQFLCQSWLRGGPADTLEAHPPDLHRPFARQLCAKTEHVSLNFYLENKLKRKTQLSEKFVTVLVSTPNPRDSVFFFLNIALLLETVV